MRKLSGQLWTFITPGVIYCYFFIHNCACCYGLYHIVFGFIMSTCNTVAAYFLGTYLCPLPVRHVICTWIVYWKADIHCEASWIKHVLLERLSELHHAIVYKSHTFFTQTEVVAREIINSQTINGILCPHWHDISTSPEMYITCNELINHIIAIATGLPRAVGQTLRRFTTSRKLI